MWITQGVKATIGMMAATPTVPKRLGHDSPFRVSRKGATKHGNRIAASGRTDAATVIDRENQATSAHDGASIRR